MRKCKIVATIGPASQSYASLEQLVKGGMNVARLNFSHGTHEDHRLEIEKIRQISQDMKLPIGILQDLQGPKLRLGIINEPVTLIHNEHVSLVNQGDLKKSGEKELPIDFPELFNHVESGDKILMDDGQIQLVVEKSDMGRIDTLVVRGGILTSHKGINLPGIVLDIPAFTKKDEDDLVFGLNLGVDAIAISFVRTVDDVIHVRQMIQGISYGIQPLLIAKLEKPEGVAHLEEIIEAADGVMVAREILE